MCPEKSLIVDTVTLTTFPKESPIRVWPLLADHGEREARYVEPCSTSNAGGSTTWVVPALGVEAQASQRGGASVGGAPLRWWARVLHTLRPATSSEVIASSPVDWPTYTYHLAAISAPSSWSVRRDQNCPDTSAEGTLELGIPEVESTCS